MSTEAQITANRLNSEKSTCTKNWLQEPCLGPEGCDGTDLDSSGSINFEDFAVFASNWLLGQ